MTASRRLAPLLLLLAGLAVLTLAVALTVQAQSQEVTPTAAATGTNPPAKPTNLQGSVCFQGTPDGVHQKQEIGGQYLYSMELAEIRVSGVGSPVTGRL